MNEYMLNIYPYGSRVYGCNMNGDQDFIMIIDSDDKEQEKQYQADGNDISIYTKSTFEKMLVDHHIASLECIFLQEKLKLKESFDFDFKLNLERLRESISKTSSNSFVKAKKKFVVEKDFNPYIARKSLFHSLRILMFGIQIAKHDRIINYAEANYLWDEIINNPSENWEDYKDKYKPLYNKLKSEFKKCAKLKSED